MFAPDDDLIIGRITAQFGVKALETEQRIAEAGVTGSGEYSARMRAYSSSSPTTGTGPSQRISGHSLIVPATGDSRSVPATEPPFTMCRSFIRRTSPSRISRTGNAKSGTIRVDVRSAQWMPGCYSRAANRKRGKES